MKNKNGFIATSVMFSFFLVFILLAMIVLASYTHYYTLINNLNGSILDDLNDNVISKKYAALTNVVTDGDMVNSSSWNMINSDVETNGNNTYIKLTNGASSSFSQNFNGKLSMGTNRKIYIAFNYLRSYSVTCDSEDFNVALKIGSTYYNSTNFTYYDSAKFQSVVRKSLMCGDWINWTNYAQIYNVNVNDNNQEITFTASNIRYLGSNLIGINNVVVVDITNLYKDETTDDQMLQYLLKNLPYFESDYSLQKV